MAILGNIFGKARAKAIEYLTIGSALTLGTAYLTQYGPGIGLDRLFGVQLGLDPCALCYYQRYPYMAVIVLGVFAMLALRGAGPRIRSYRLLALGVIVVLLFAGAAIAGYHIGVEQAWWAGPNTCSGGATGLGTVDLSRALGTKPIVRCDQPTNLWFGISMTTYNLVIALSFTIFGLMSFLGLRKTEQVGL